MPFPSEERLQYTVFYRGWFSAGIRLAVARAELLTRSAEYSLDGHGVHQISLSATTAPYRKAELIYPLRYHYESWFSGDLPRTLLVCVWQKGQQAEQNVLWFDWRMRVVKRYRWRENYTIPDNSSTATRSPLPKALFERYAASAGGANPLIYEGRGELMLVGRGLDYAALLHQLRYRDLRTGMKMQLPVSDGKELVAYRVYVEARESLEQGERVTQAYRLALYPVYREGEKTSEPVQVWISADAQRLPLRFLSRRKYGTIEVELQQ